MKVVNLYLSLNNLAGISRRRIDYPSIFVVIILVFFLVGCENVDVRRVLKVKTSGYSDLTSHSVKISGIFIDVGEFEISEYGICWRSDYVPYISDNLVKAGSALSVYDFTTMITGLIPGNTYYFRVFARSDTLIVYGETIILVTPEISIPSVITSAYTELTSISVKCGGNVTGDGFGSVTKRGVCWGIENNPTIRDSRSVNGEGKGVFISQISNLMPQTKYYVRAYATNEKGTAYGMPITITTPAN